MGTIDFARAMLDLIIVENKFRVSGGRDDSANDEEVLKAFQTIDGAQLKRGLPILLGWKEYAAFVRDNTQLVLQGDGLSYIIHRVAQDQYAVGLYGNSTGYEFDSGEKFLP